MDSCISSRNSVTTLLNVTGSASALGSYISLASPEDDLVSSYFLLSASLTSFSSAILINSLCRPNPQSKKAEVSYCLNAKYASSLCLSLGTSCFSVALLDPFIKDGKYGLTSAIAASVGTGLYASGTAALCFSRKSDDRAKPAPAIEHGHEMV